MQYEIRITVAVLISIWASFEINSLVRLGDSYQSPSLPDRPVLIKWILVVVLFAITLVLSGCANQYAQGFKYERDRNEAGEYIGLWKSPARTLREGGDCEDYATLARANRIKAGQDPKTMSIEKWKKNDSKWSHVVLNVDGDRYSNHGFHGETVRGYTFVRTYEDSQIDAWIKQGESIPSLVKSIR